MTSEIHFSNLDSKSGGGHYRLLFFFQYSNFHKQRLICHPGPKSPARADSPVSELTDKDISPFSPNFLYHYMFTRTLRLAPTLLKTPFTRTLITTSRMSAPYQVVATDSEYLRLCLAQVVSR